MAAAAATRADEELTRLADVVVPNGVDELQVAVTAAEEDYVAAGTAERAAATAAVAAEEALGSGPGRGWLEETLRWHGELTSAAERTAGATRAADTGRAGLEQAERAATSARETLEKTRAEHDRDRLAQERAAAAVAEVTGRIDVLRSVRQPADAGDLDAAVAAARVRWQAARRALDGAETALTQAQATVAALPERSAVDVGLRTLADYQTTVAQLAALRTRRRTNGGQLREAEASLAAAADAQRRAADDVERVRSQAVAADLRPHLQVGDACPVCAQTVAQLPPPLSVPALAGARAVLDDAVRRVAEVETIVQRLRTGQIALDTQLTGVDERLAELDRRLAGDLADHPSGPERDPRQDHGALTELIGRLDTAVEQQRAASAAVGSARTALQQAEEEGGRLAAAAQQGWADLHATTGRLTALGAPTVTAETLGTAWSALLSWAADLTEVLTTRELPTVTAALGAAEGDLAATAARLAASVDADLASRAALTRAALVADQARSELTALSDLIAERQRLLADRPGVDETRRLLAEHLRLAERAVTARSRAQQEASARHRAETVREQRRAEQQTARELLLRVRDGVAALGVPTLDANDLPRAWADLADWAAEQADRRRSDLVEGADTLQRLDADLGRRFASVRDLLEEHGVEGPEDAVPADPTAPAAAGRMARIPTLVELQLERSRSATAAVVKRRRAAERLRTTIATDTETEQVSRTLQQLMSAKRFPQWLADAALDTLVADASASLLQLSGGQFELTHDRGEFFVIDHADADSRRSVKTLSGGETFQASLALALALSEQLATLAAGGRTTLDSIFLDEGFGTLDPDALEIVAGTLENLAQGTRMVGVVTHVAALAERVPVRFEVSRDSRTSTIRRVGT